MKLLTSLLIYLGLICTALAQGAVPSTTNSIQIAGTVAASTRIVTGAVGKQIYVTGLILTPVATSVVTFTTGTGTNCGTNTASVTGAMTFAAGQEVNWGTGNGALLVLPTAFDLCITIATAVAPGALAYSLGSLP